MKLSPQECSDHAGDCLGVADPIQRLLVHPPSAAPSGHPLRNKNVWRRTFCSIHLCRVHERRCAVLSSCPNLLGNRLASGDGRAAQAAFTV